MCTRIRSYPSRVQRPSDSCAQSGGGGGSGGRGGGGSGGGSNDVVTLTDSNFKELVLDSQTVWFVEFFAPWCGHCKNLEPKWKAAATEVKEKTEGTIKLGALDATVHQSTAGRYGVRFCTTFSQESKNTSFDCCNLVWLTCARWTGDRSSAKVCV